MAAVGIVVGAALGLLALTRAVWGLVKNVYRWAKQMETYAEYIDAELRHNGGDSLRDELCRQGLVLDGMAAAGKRRDERIAHLEEQVDAQVGPQVDDIHGVVVDRGDIS